MNVLDHTNSFWITAFNEVAEQIMGVSANDLMKLKVGNGFLLATASFIVCGLIQYY
jgi:hypothetical protein